VLSWQPFPAASWVVEDCIASPIRAGARAGLALLGHAAAVARDPARHRRGSAGAQALARRHRHRHLGVDYGLLGGDGALIDNPRHYRDSRTNGMMEKLFETVPRDQVFGYTGIQFMQLNTLYQLYAQKLAGSPALGAAHRLLNMPDLFNYWLTGVAKSEITIASTTQFFNPRDMNWSMEMPEAAGSALRDPGRNWFRRGRCWARCWSRPTRRYMPPPGTIRRRPWRRCRRKAATTGAMSARGRGR